MARTNRQSEPLKRTSAINYAATLARLGARPPTISALLPYLPETTIKDVWAEVRGARSKKGPTPYSFHAHFQTPLRRIQSTYALMTFLEYRRTGIHDIEAMVATYSRYCHLFGQQSEQKGLTFDHLFFLVKNYVNDRSVTLERCDCCGHVHIFNPVELRTQAECPLRKIFPNINQPIKVAAKATPKPATPKAESLISTGPRLTPVKFAPGQGLNYFLN